MNTLSKPSETIQNPNGYIIGQLYEILNGFLERGIYKGISQKKGHHLFTPEHEQSPICKVREDEIGNILQ